jgi:glycerate-2-kinase
MTAAAREFLESLFRTAVAAAHPASCLRPHLPPPPASGRLLLLAAGKAAGLVDVKVVGFSTTHTAEKFVIPKAAR